MEDLVEITCYGRTEKMQRKQAIQKYLECMNCSEGSERDRYVNIFMALVNGDTKCKDE